MSKNNTRSRFSSLNSVVNHLLDDEAIYSENEPVDSENDTDWDVGSLDRRILNSPTISSGTQSPVQDYYKMSYLNENFTSDEDDEFVGVVNPNKM